MRVALASLGLVGILLVGCGRDPSSPVAAPAGAMAPGGGGGAPVAAAVSPVPTAGYQDATATVTYHDPRYPFYSDKFDLASGAFEPVEDGMSPTGDFSFFFDGQAFHIVVNQDGGASRSIALANGSTTETVLPVAAGDAYRVRTDGGTGWVIVSAADPGSMRFQGETGGGQGKVSFRYRFDPVGQSSM